MSSGDVSLQTEVGDFSETVLVVDDGIKILHVQKQRFIEVRRGSGGLQVNTLPKAEPAKIAQGLCQYSFEDVQGWRFLLSVSGFFSSV